MNIDAKILNKILAISVAPTMRLLFEFPHETGLIQRFAVIQGTTLQDTPTCLRIIRTKPVFMSVKLRQ